jgi:hypothetical protein
MPQSVASTEESKLAPVEVVPPPPCMPPTAPGALPVSVTDYQLKWQPTTDTPAQGEWNTPGKTREAPRKTVPGASPADGKQSAAPELGSNVVARGQAGDNKPDPVITQIKRLCTGKAEGVDVRWTGTKRVSVCFECRTVAEAQQLVRELCARPELVPLRIDFCVLIK